MVDIRKSQYLIKVDIPRLPDSLLLINGRTGAFDLVSRNVATYIDKYDIFHPREKQYNQYKLISFPDRNSITVSDTTIKKLIERGHLTELDPIEENKAFTEFITALHDRELSNGCFIIPTYDCNLTCNYCFQSGRRHSLGCRNEQSLISKQMIDRIYIAANQLNIDSKSSAFNIGLYGGEPLLRRNSDAIRYMIKKFHSKIKSVITNGTEIQFYEDLLGPDGVSLLQITLDGSQEIHDRRRIYADGQGSFCQIASNIDLCLKKGCSVRLRVNCDSQNIHSLINLSRFIISKRWHDNANFSAYAAPLVKSNPKLPESESKIADKSRESLNLQGLIESALERFPEMGVIATPDQTLISSIQQVFSDNSMLHPHSSFCSAHTGMHLFDLFGNIYACWEHAGDSSQRIGQLRENGKIEYVKERRDIWRNRTAASYEPCNHCRYALFCGGGCASRAESQNGTIYGNFCDNFQNRFKHAVVTAYSKHYI